MYILDIPVKIRAAGFEDMGKMGKSNGQIIHLEVFIQ